MTTFTPSVTMVESVLADEVYHSAGQTINTSNLGGYVPAIDSTGKPIALYDAASGYYGEVWGAPNGTGGYSSLILASRGTVVGSVTTGTNQFGINLSATQSADMGNTLLDDVQIAGSQALGLGNIGISATPSDYTAAAQKLFNTVEADFPTTPLNLTGQSLGGYTTEWLDANNIGQHSNITATTFNALPYTATEATADGVTSAELNAASTSLHNDYVDNEQLTQSVLLGTSIGTNQNLGTLPVDGPDQTNMLTIHSTDAAVAEAFLSQYPSTDTNYAAEKSWLASTYSAANSNNAQAPIAAVINGTTPTSDVASGEAAVDVNGDGYITVSTENGQNSVLESANGYAVTSPGTTTGVVSQTVIDNNSGVQVGTETQEANGQVVLQVDEQSTGGTFNIALNGSNGQAVSGSASSSVDYNGFIAAVVDTLATQLISKVLLKNNIPASVIATAFASSVNAPMESFFHTLKTELVHHKNYATKEDAKRDLFQYIEGFYNRQRIHSALGYLTPEQMEQKAA